MELRLCLHYQVLLPKTAFGQQNRESVHTAMRPFFWEILPVSVTKSFHPYERGFSFPLPLLSTKSRCRNCCLFCRQNCRPPVSHNACPDRSAQCFDLCCPASMRLFTFKVVGSVLLPVGNTEQIIGICLFCPALGTQGQAVAVAGRGRGETAALLWHSSAWRAHRATRDATPSRWGRTQRESSHDVQQSAPPFHNTALWDTLLTLLMVPTMWTWSVNRGSKCEHSLAILFCRQNLVV